MHRLESEMELPIDLATAWDFFSDPANLKKITPDFMGFDILSGADTRMYPGMMIRYRIRPLLGIPVEWVTEITHVQEKSYFVDEQRIGPYKIWHHEHHFEKTSKGVRMKDILHYEMPFGILGKFVHWFMVGARVQQIFEYRTKVLEEMFPEKIRKTVSKKKSGTRK